MKKTALIFTSALLFALSLTACDSREIACDCKELVCYCTELACGMEATCSAEPVAASGEIESGEDENWCWEEFSQRYSVFDGYAGIRIMNEELLDKFDYVHEIGTYVSGGEDIIIWALNEPLAGFEFSKVVDGNDGTFDDFFFVPGDVVFSLDVLPRNHAVVLRNHIGHSLWPVWNISFLDTNERQRYVGFHSDNSAEIAPFLFVELALEDGKPPWALPPWNVADDHIAPS